VHLLMLCDALKALGDNGRFVYFCLVFGLAGNPGRDGKMCF
jgi:hypothetical protein